MEGRGGMDSGREVLGRLRGSEGEDEQWKDLTMRLMNQIPQALFGMHKPSQLITIK